MTSDPIIHERRVAIVAGGRTYTYGDLERASRAVAGALLNSAEDLAEARVAFLVAPGFEYVAVQRGIWQAGGVAVPLATSHPAAELDYVVGDAGATSIVFGPGFEDRSGVLTGSAGARVLSTNEVLQGSEPVSLPHLGASRRAMIVYTSGTTARPKGVVATHANIGAQIAAQIEAWEWAPADRMLLTLPLHHLHGIINGLEIGRAHV